MHIADHWQQKLSGRSTKYAERAIPFYEETNPVRFTWITADIQPFVTYIEPDTVFMSTICFWTWNSRLARREILVQQARKTESKRVS